MVNNNRGFSLIEIIIACAIMSLVALGFASMMSNSSSDLKFVEAKMEVVQLKNQFLMAMTNETYCGCAFRNHTLNTTTNAMTTQPDNFAFAYDPATCDPSGGGVVFQSNAAVPNSKLFVGAMRVDRIAVDDAATGKYTAFVVVPFDQARTQLTRQLRDIEFPIRITVDPAAAGAGKPVTDCTANMLAVPPSVAAFSSDYCYAPVKPAQDTPSSCADGFYVKALLAFHNGGEDWDGFAAVCCYGSTGNPPADVIATIGPNGGRCVGCSYSNLVADCEANKIKYGNGGDVTCPGIPGQNWGNWVTIQACNAPVGCGSSGTETKRKTCVGPTCPNPAFRDRTDTCWNNAACPPPDAP